MFTITQGYGTPAPLIITQGYASGAVVALLPGGTFTEQPRSLTFTEAARSLTFTEAPRK